LEEAKDRNIIDFYKVIRKFEAGRARTEKFWLDGMFTKTILECLHVSSCLFLLIHLRTNLKIHMLNCSP